MTKNQLVALCVRLAGFYILLNTLVFLPHALRMLFDQGQLQKADGWWLLSVHTLWWTAAACMIAFPQTVAGNWLSRHADQPLSFQWSRGDIEGTAFTLVGLYFSLHAIRELSYWMSSWVFAFLFYRAGRLDGWPSEVGITFFNNAPALVAAVVEFGIGLWLLFGAVGLRKLLRWARHSGDRPVDVSSPDPGSQGKP